MYGLIQALYNDKKQEAFKSLYVNSESKDQLLLRSTIAEALKDCPKILKSHGSDWILCTLSSYHQSPEDTTRIYQGIMKHLEHFSFGLLTDDIKWREMNDVADSCLVGLSFFKENINFKHKRKAAPSPEYYFKVGSVAFQRLGFDKIGSDFTGWVQFIQKEMT
jgi:hypothetical protein